MPAENDILKALANEMAPLHRNKIAEMMGETSYRPIQTQLNRLVEKGQATVTPDHEYSITEAGKNRLAEQTITAEETDEEKLGTTEYQQFIKFGKMTGVSPPELIKQTVDHVWAGGDFHDLEWVARAFQEMGIRQDLRNRWWHSWRSYLHQPIPSQLPSEIVEGEVKDVRDTKGKKESKGTRSYILAADDALVYVGEGLGDMYYDDAMELSKIRAGRGSKAVATAQTPGSMADEMVKLFNAFQQFTGEKAQGKSWIMRQGENGNVQVEEAEPGRPMVISYPQGNKAQPTVLVTPEGEVQEVQPGQPIIIRPPAPAQPAGQVQYLVDKQTGQVTQVQPGQPIIIQTAPQSPFTPLQYDKDGKPMAPPNLETWFKLEDWKIDQQRKQERHEVTMDIGKGFKELLSKAAAAASHIAEKK